LLMASFDSKPWARDYRQGMMRDLVVQRGGARIQARTWSGLGSGIPFCSPPPPPCMNFKEFQPKALDSPAV
jgi:hypothetical protein